MLTGVNEYWKSLTVVLCKSSGSEFTESPPCSESRWDEFSDPKLLTPSRHISLLNPPFASCPGCDR